VTGMSLSDVVNSSPQGPRRRSQRAAEKRRKRRRRRTWVTALILVAGLGAAGAGAWLGLRPLVSSIMSSFGAPDDYTGSGTTPVDVRIPPGATGTRIAALLVDAGVVKSAKAYLDAADDTPGSTGIQPGTYAMKKQMPARAALQALLDPGSRQLKKVTIPEGSRVTTILAAVAKATGIPRAQLDAAAKDTAALGLPAGVKTAEGYLFPATYAFEPGTTAEDLLREMVAKTEDTLGELGVAAGEQHRVLTLASLVQAEGRHTEDMGRIARVLVSRLSKGIPLQLDTTVHYATGKFTVQTTNADLAVNSPYNTYTHKGLPPGPIGSPGVDALRAAISPTEGPWLYFVATDPSTGKTEFGVTEADFMRLKAKYDKWQKAHPGQ
jgi:UPF0755 protein